MSPPQDRLSSADLNRLLAAVEGYGFRLSGNQSSEERLRELRYMYEPFLYSLADYLCLDIPPWISGGGYVDNWQVSAWGETTL